jgi:hypothetical protein
VHKPATSRIQKAAATVVLALALLSISLPPANLNAQPVTPPDNCTEVMRVGRIFIGHDCGEFASVLISGRVVIRKPWSRANRASRAVRIRERRESGEVSAPAPTAAPTSSPAPTPTPTPAAGRRNGDNSNGGASADELDCGDFDTQVEAQAYFDEQGWSASNDPFGLDDGGEPGIVCESLP